MRFSPNVQPGRSVHDRMRFYKLNSHDLHKPERSDSRGSSEATADAFGSLKLERNVRNLQLIFKLIFRQIGCPVTAEKVQQRGDYTYSRTSLKLRTSSASLAENLGRNDPNWGTDVWHELQTAEYAQNNTLTQVFNVGLRIHSLLSGWLTSSSGIKRCFASGSSGQTGAWPPFWTQAATWAERLLQKGDARGRRVQVKMTGYCCRCGTWRSRGRAGRERWWRWKRRAEQGRMGLQLLTRLSFFVAGRGVRWRPCLEALSHWGGATTFSQGAGSVVHVGVLELLSGDLPGQSHLWWLRGPGTGWRKVELWPRRVMIQKKMLGPPAWVYWQEAVTRWRRWVGSLRQKYRRQNKWLSEIEKHRFMLRPRYFASEKFGCI